MNHSRRELLRRLLGLGAVAALAEDPESAIWIPGQRKIFIPPAPKKIIAPDPTEVTLKATARYYHRQYGLAVRINTEMLEDNPEIERLIANKLRAAMEATPIPWEAWNPIRREVSIDRQAIQQRFCQSWLLPASRLPA